MKTISYLSPVPRFDRETKTYIRDIVTLYNVELVEAFGNKVYQGTTTKNGKKLAYCCPSKVIELKTL
jgi:hypothetical protein